MGKLIESKYSWCNNIIDNTFKFDKIRWQTNWRREHPDKAKEYERKSRGRYKKIIMDLLGGRCVRCGINDWRVLQIDHVNGGGTKEKKRYGGNGYYIHIIRKLKEGSKDYQLLCANCNWIKKYENGEVRKW